MKTRHLFILLALFLFAGFIAPRPQATPPVVAAPVTSHPRLWLTSNDIPRLRSWAVPSNPIYQNGLHALALEAIDLMDNPGIGQPGNRLPGQDNGGNGYTPYYTEAYAQLFAFMSLVDNDPTARADYAQRARTLLMYIMDQAVLGPADGVPFRGSSFATSDRSRWAGQAFGLTTDWIYNTLTPADKATIHTVFLRWAEENLSAYPNPGYFTPVAPDVFNDPILLDLSDPLRRTLRFSGNNYFVAHMRNNGLMSLAFDPADDPNDALAFYLHNAIGQWLYMTDYLYSHDAAGGLGPEGFLYMHSSMGFPAQFLLALHTAGQDDTAVWGPQVRLTNNPFWEGVVPGFLHSLSPAPVNNPNLGQIYQPAWYGDGEDYHLIDFIRLMGPLGLYDYYTGNQEELEAIRWIEQFTPPGGESTFYDRASSGEDINAVVMLFMLFDPAAAPPANPTTNLPLHFYAPGIGRILSRTSWDASASLFSYKLGWNRIDHQFADGNMFDFYRNGEWLTKEDTGYGVHIASSDHHNTLTLQNNPPEGDPNSSRYIHALRGSQFILSSPAGDPQVLAYSLAPDFTYALGDATNLYNTTANYPYTDILHASRSILWLKPDVVVVYDRAESQTDGRFKRFWLSLTDPAPTINGNLTTSVTPNGQQLFITTLLPNPATLQIVTDDPTLESWAPAENDVTAVRLMVEAPGGPTSARFLHVLEGADSGATASPAALIESSGGVPFAGALVAGTAVLFPVDLNTPFTTLTYQVPANTTAHLITGLVPGAGYGVTIQDNGVLLTVTITPNGSDATADSGGVLAVGGIEHGYFPVYLPLVLKN